MKLSQIKFDGNRVAIGVLVSMKQKLRNKLLKCANAVLCRITDGRSRKIDNMDAIANETRKCDCLMADG